MNAPKSGVVWPARLPRWTHPLLRAIWPGTMWATEASQEVHLTFDDGPHADITPWVLTCLEERQMTATFFVIGHHAQTHGTLLRRMRDAGHAIGGHTMNHEHGWRTDTARYLDSARTSVDATGSNDGLFRPPHGKLRRVQAARLRSHAQVVMWDVLSGDYAATGNEGAQRVLRRLKRHTRPGSIVVLHDSLKCEEVLRRVLPAYLDWIQSQGWTSVRLKPHNPM